MTPVLSARLKRLEHHHDIRNPLAHLTDEELDARLKAVTDQIEFRVGMSIADYADVISAALNDGGGLPADWTAEGAHEFAGMLKRISEERAANGH